MTLDELLNIGGYAASATTENGIHTVTLLSIPSVFGQGKYVHEAVKEASDNLNNYISSHPGNIPKADYNTKFVEIYDELYRNIIDICHDSYTKWNRQTIAEQYLVVMANLSHVNAEPTGNIKEFLDILLQLWISKGGI